MSNEKKIIKLQQHKQYTTSWGDWQELDTFYRGDRKTLRSSSYLIPHEFERLDTDVSRRLRSAREERTEYFNLIKPFIKRFSSFVFSKGVNLGNAKEALKEYLEDVDGQGSSLERFFRKEVAPNYFLYGKAITSVDSPTLAGVSRGDEKEKGIRPRVFSWSPQSVKDWSLNEDGSLKWIRVSYMRETERSHTEECEMTEYSKVFSQDLPNATCLIYKGNDSNAEEVSYIALGVPSVPFVITESESWVKDGLGLARSIHNKRSVKDNIFHFQAHRQLIAVGGFAQEEGKTVASSEGSIMIFNGEGSIIVVEPVNPIGLMSDIREEISNLFRVLTLQTRTIASDSKQAESAESQDEQKSDFKAAMIEAAEDMQRMMRETINLWAEFVGINNFKSDLVVDKDFNTQDVEQFMQWAAMFYREISSVEIWRKETLKKAAQRMGLASEDEIIKAIEGATFEQETIRRPSILSTRARQEENERDSTSR